MRLFFLALVVACLSLSDATVVNGKHKPNILFILTDDQDRQLGSMAVMPNAEKYITNRGANVTNMFVNTPICCPSRANIFSGRFNHNLRTPSYPGSAAQRGDTVPSGGKAKPGSAELCMFMNVSMASTDYWDRTMAKGLQAAGYSTGAFGKTLNNGAGGSSCGKTGCEIPPNWDHWEASRHPTVGSAR